MKQQSFSCLMKYFLHHMDKIRTNTSVLKNRAENCNFSPLRQIIAKSDQRKTNSSEMCQNVL